MPAIDPYASPARQIVRQNQYDRGVAKNRIARNNPGYGVPSPRNSPLPDTSGDRWEEVFKNTPRVSPMPPPTPKEQQGFAAAAQQRANMARRTPTKPAPIQPFAPAPLPKPMQVAGASATQQTPHGKVGVSYAAPNPQIAGSAMKGRIFDETGDRTAEFSEQRPRPKPRINQLGTVPRTATR